MSSCPPAIAPDPETDDFLERVERLAVSARSELVGKHRCGRDMPVRLHFRDMRIIVINSEIYIRTLASCVTQNYLFIRFDHISAY